MTEGRPPLVELLAKAGDGDFLRGVAEAVARLLMETDVEGVIGAGRHERTGARQHTATATGTGRRTPGWAACNCASRDCGRAATFLPSSTGQQAMQGHRQAGEAFLDRALAGEWPYLWLDATYLKQREGGRIVSVAVIIAVVADSDGKPEIVGLHIAPSAAETFWSSFLESLVRRALRGVKLVISDAHEGKAAIRRVMGAAWQRCRAQWMRNALSYVPKGRQSMVSAARRQASIQPDRATASQTLRRLADPLRATWPKLGAFIDGSETDGLAHMDFAAQHRSKIHSANPLERLNKEVKRRANGVGIFPNEGVIIRLIGAVVLEATTSGSSSTATCRPTRWPN